MYQRGVRGLLSPLSPLVKIKRFTTLTLFFTLSALFALAGTKAQTTSGMGRIPANGNKLIHKSSGTLTDTLQPARQSGTLEPTPIQAGDGNDNPDPGSGTPPTHPEPAPIQAGDGNDNPDPGSGTPPTNPEPAPIQAGDGNDNPDPGSGTPSTNPEPEPIQAGDGNDNPDPGSGTPPTNPEPAPIQAGDGNDNPDPDGGTSTPEPNPLQAGDGNDSPDPNGGGGKRSFIPGAVPDDALLFFGDQTALAGNMEATAVIFARVTDDYDNSYLLGTFQEMLTLSETSLLGFGGRDLFLAKFDAAGDLVWMRVLGSGGEDVPSALLLDTWGNITLAGRFSEPLRVGNRLFQSMGYTDLFVANFDPEGELTWARQIGSNGRDSLVDAFVNGAGDLVFDVRSDVFASFTDGLDEPVETLGYEVRYSADGRWLTPGR